MGFIPFVLNYAHVKSSKVIKKMFICIDIKSAFSVG